MSKDDFLSRWSRRKQVVEQEKADAEVKQAADASSMDDPQIAMLEEGDANLIESEIDAELEGEVDAEVEGEVDGELDGEEEGEETEPHPAEGIDIETLDYESDFTVFMDAKVPEALRRMALRKLWRSNPILANIDGLNDYDEDFTDATAIFINSTGDVISGTRDQIWDDKQIAEGKDKIGDDEAEETEEASSEETEQSDAEAEEETQVTETEEVDGEETEVSEAAEAEEVEGEDIETAEVEDIDDFDDLDFTTNDKVSQPEQTASSVETAEEEKLPTQQARLEDDKDRDEETEENSQKKTKI